MADESILWRFGHIKRMENSKNDNLVVVLHCMAFESDVLLQD